MGQIVAAMATLHAPQLFTRPPGEDPAQLDAGLAAMGRLGQLLPQQAPYKFLNDPHEFYVHPAVSAYKLNKLLYDTRHMPVMWQQLLKNPAAVVSEQKRKMRGTT